MKATFYFLILSFIGLTFTSSMPKEKWQSYSSETAKFSVKFPGDYVTKIEIKNNSTLHEAKAVLGKKSFLASCSINKEELKESLELAEVSLNTFNDQVTGTLISKEPWKIGEFEGLSAEIEMASGLYLVMYKVIIVENRHYQVVMAAEKADFPSEVAKKFFKSFKLKK